MAIKFNFILLCLFLYIHSTKAQRYKPDFILHRDRYTAFLIFDAKRSAELEPNFRNTYNHLKFWTDGWTRPKQKASWNITAPATDDYVVDVVLRQHSNAPLAVTVEENNQIIKEISRFSKTGWKRLILKGRLHLDSGMHTITLRIKPLTGNDTFHTSVHSIELVRPVIKDQLHRSAMALRSKADLEGFRKFRFGLFIHWTSMVYPRNGDRKSYADAVRDFNVEGFANQVKQTGAGFVVFTTSHAEMYFPAPLKSLDSILPGRTAQRDLIADLIKALNARGIKLFLYFHPGTVDDSMWSKTSGFWETDITHYFKNWHSIIQEVGKRYGEKLVGWWFDDGSMNYYYRSPDWEQLYITAKAGNPQRVITFNTWKLPPPTEFMDYNPGETIEEPDAQGWLIKNGNGILNGGTYKGLQEKWIL